MVQNGSQWVELLMNGGISLAFSLGVSAIVVLCNRNFRNYLKICWNKVFRHNKADDNTAKHAEAEKQE